jgi:hypothetical protein
MSRQLDFLIYFWASLSVGDTARASITGTSRLSINEQTLSLLLILYQEIAQSFAPWVF